jgi:hypothetical protein
MICQKCNKEKKTSKQYQFHITKPKTEVATDKLYSVYTKIGTDSAQVCDACIYKNQGITSLISLPIGIIIFILEYMNAFLFNYLAIFMFILGLLFIGLAFEPYVRGKQDIGERIALKLRKSEVVKQYDFEPAFFTSKELSKLSKENLLISST